MKASANFLRSMMQDAKNPGPELVPVNVLEAVRLSQKPLNETPDTDLGNAFFNALHEQLGYLNAFDLNLGHLTPDARDKWIAVIRWVNRELQTWSKAIDPAFHKLTTLFVVTACCDIDSEFWNSAPKELSENTELLLALEQLIKALNIEFKSRNAINVPLWEKESVERFKEMDRECDWLAISELCRQLQHAWTPNVFVAQMVRCLNRFGFDHLIRAVTATNQTFTAQSVVNALSTSDGIRLALVSRNCHIQFSCASHVVGWFRSEQLTDEEYPLLVELFRQVADDSPRWAQWMQVFNRHPLRYPCLQPALGEVLAFAPVFAVHDYVNSISLSASFSGSGVLIAECLCSFGKTAPQERRHLLWSLAHTRWSEWEFDLQDSDQLLFEVKGSELDYAVVGYAVECLTGDQRKVILERIIAALSTLDNGWHKSHSDCTSAWHRLLSKLQPYAHAEDIIRSNKNWLLAGHWYSPIDTLGLEYLCMMYDMKHPLPAAVSGNALD